MLILKILLGLFKFCASIGIYMIMVVLLKCIIHYYNSFDKTISQYTEYIMYFGIGAIAWLIINHFDKETK